MTLEHMLGVQYPVPIFSSLVLSFHIRSLISIFKLINNHCIFVVVVVSFLHCL